MMESMHSEPRSNATQEYYLQGSILDTEVELLLHRIQALCDSGRIGESFRDHEIVLSLPKHLPPEMQMTLRVRKSLRHDNKNLSLRYVGTSEISERPTSVRTCISFMTNETAIDFLTTLGFNLDHDFIAQGFIFLKGIMKVTVSKIYKTSNKFSDNVHWCAGTQTPVSDSHLVEMSVLAPSGMSSTIGQNMRQFSDQLLPLVRMEKVEDIRVPYSCAL